MAYSWNGDGRKHTPMMKGKLRNCDGCGAIYDHGDILEFLHAYVGAQAFDMWNLMTVCVEINVCKFFFCDGYRDE
jgi:hypothetical protein